MTAHLVTHAEVIRESAPDRVWHSLTPAQADGLSCVHCGVSYLLVSVPHRPVGRSETGSQVFSCTWIEHDQADAEL